MKKNLNGSALESVLNTMPEETRIKVAEKRFTKRVGHDFATTVNVIANISRAPVKPITSALFKLNPNKHHPYIAHAICSFLLKREMEFETCINTLQKFSDKRVVGGYYGNPYDYELALLMLEHHPEKGLPILRRSLRSDTPAAVESTAALLATIGEDWSNQELISAVNDNSFTENPECLRYITAALLCSNNPNIRRIGSKLKPTSKIREPEEIGYTFDEILELNMDKIFPYALELVREDLKKLDLKKIKDVATTYQIR